VSQWRWYSVQKRRTLRRTLLQYQRDCQSLDAPTTGGAANPSESARLAMMSRSAGGQATALTSSGRPLTTGQPQVAAVSFKAAGANV